MWVIEKYMWWLVSFAGLWGILFVSTHFSCSSVTSNQMQPFVTNESFIVVHAGKQFPGQLEVQKDVLQFEYASKGKSPTFVARLIGKPGDRIRISRGRVFRTERGGSHEEQLAEQYVSPELLSPDAEEMEDILVPRGCYWLMGDNRKKEADKDSRKYGPIPVHAVDGTVDRMPFTR